MALAVILWNRLLRPGVQRLVGQPVRPDLLSNELGPASFGQKSEGHSRLGERRWRSGRSGCRRGARVEDARLKAATPAATIQCDSVQEVSAW